MKRRFDAIIMGLILYTDGSCRDNTKPGPENPASYAFVLLWRGVNPFDHDDGVVLRTGSGQVQELFSEIPELVGTNNTAELAALVFGLRCHVSMFPGMGVVVYTDSMYVINVLKMREEKAAVALNAGLVRLVREEVRNSGASVLHIKGHSGIVFNEMADRLAKGELWIGTPS
jgi:ribonuclease HI